MKKRYRTANIKLMTRAEGDDRYIEGYFVVYGDVYKRSEYFRETIMVGAAADAAKPGADVRALINHDTTLVIGRTIPGTLTLREDEHGLWGSILINPQDSAAMDVWARVDRGDVSGCSIGFDDWEYYVDVLADGYTLKRTVTRLNIREVSVCTFPAYEGTEVSARSAAAGELEAKELAAWKAAAKRRLKNGTESVIGQDKD